MVSWKFPNGGQLHEALGHFSKMTPEQEFAGLDGKIKLIGRWHDLARGRGVAICDSESAEALANWALNWNSLLDIEVVPVLDNRETRALGKARKK